MEYPRKVLIEDKKLSEWLDKKAEWLTKGQNLTKEIEKLEQDRNKCGLQIQKYKDKIIPRTEELAKDLLEHEFEELERIELVDGKIEFTIINRLEEWKKLYLEQKNNNKAT